MAKIVDFSQFQTNLNNNSVADYSWISSDQCHDIDGRGAAVLVTPVTSARFTTGPAPLGRG